MISWRIGKKRTLTVELRNGTGLDIEFVDSRPVWTYSETTQEIEALPFCGTVVLLPLFTITFGYVYKMEDVNNE